MMFSLAFLALIVILCIITVWNIADNAAVKKRNQALERQLAQVLEWMDATDREIDAIHRSRKP